jgi:hypothetical protein
MLVREHGGDPMVPRIAMMKALSHIPCRDQHRVGNPPRPTSLLDDGGSKIQPGDDLMNLPLGTATSPQSAMGCTFRDVRTRLRQKSQSWGSY